MFQVKRSAVAVCREARKAQAKGKTRPQKKFLAIKDKTRPLAIKNEMGAKKLIPLVLHGDGFHVGGTYSNSNYKNGVTDGAEGHFHLHHPISLLPLSSSPSFHPLSP